jgi:hypothetical protein
MVAPVVVLHGSFLTAAENKTSQRTISPNRNSKSAFETTAVPDVNNGTGGR